MSNIKISKIMLIVLILFIFLNTIEYSESISISSKTIVDTRAVASQTSILISIDATGYDLTFSEFGGETINLSALTKKQLQNISDLILESVHYGKMMFIENINISHDTNIDFYINMSQNRIELNSTALSNFNKSAALYLYNLTFKNPRVVKDGIVCPSTICVENSYIDGTFSFNVTHFTVYSAEETPSEEEEAAPSATAGGGGGGGETALRKISKFTILDKVIKVNVEQGSTKDYFLKILNSGNTKLNLNLKLDIPLDFVFIEGNLESYTLSIEPDQAKAIKFTFSPDDDLEPEIYISQLLIEDSSKKVKKVIPLVAEVRSKGLRLFDVSVEILEGYQRIKAGEEVIAEITLLNLGVPGIVDAKIEYFIKDLKGNIIISDHETIAVETQLQKTKEMTVPSYLIAGDYVFAVKAVYNGRMATSSALFEITPQLQPEVPFRFGFNINLLLTLAILIIIILFISYQFKLIKLFRSRIKEGKEYREQKTLQETLIKKPKVKKEVKESSLFKLFKKKEKPKKREEIIKAIKEAKKKLR